MTGHRKITEQIDVFNMAAKIPISKLKAKGRGRTNFAVQHLMAAAYFSRKVHKIETINFGKEFGLFFDKILWFSTACVFSSVASIESYFNELFADSAENFPNYTDEIKIMMWGLIEKKSILTKFNFALALRGAREFDKADSNFNNMLALIALRNALIHFKPEWEDKQKNHLKISPLLKKKFAPSTFILGNEGIFPRKWASHGCTVWAIESCLTFIEDFENRMKITAKFELFLQRLKT